MAWYRSWTCSWLRFATQGGFGGRACGDVPFLAFRDRVSFCLRLQRRGARTTDQACSRRPRTRRVRTAVLRGGGEDVDLALIHI
ncbi:hypothetical protein B0H12DRAFT_1151200 [Mycena haematopus]|nr:hypothetical protein B0H12DRAFT_1151200 [Mycena haematopus]